MNRTKTLACFLSFLLAWASAAHAKEIHVALSGKDANDGTQAAPLRSIQHAADLAQPGDIVTVHTGVYREQISPPRGGESIAKRITYRAAPGEKVVITGSEPAKTWQKVSNDTWKLTLPNKSFGKFNPYNDLIRGDWFRANGRPSHTGAVYLNGQWLLEAARQEDVMQPAGMTPLWFATVDGAGAADYATKNTTIWGQFPGVDPNKETVEINVRKTVFTPEKTGVNYITLRGFMLRNAATNWASPTAGQIGLVSAYWCKGWIIENNDIAYSKCSGVALAKYSDEWDNRGESAEGFASAITRALKNGWNKETVGSHVVRNNHIHHCEQAGLVGSLGCAFSTIAGNDIHDIHVYRLLGGSETAGIKFHGAIDVFISGNHIYRCGEVAGIYLDWMAQGAEVTRNLLHDNLGADIFCEMQHGPLLIANNLLLSRGRSLVLDSQGVAVAHNLIRGTVLNYRGDKRITPFQQAHSTAQAGMYVAAQGDSGDNRFYNNLFVAPCNLHAIDDSALPCFAAGNVFVAGAQASKFDSQPLLLPKYDPMVGLVEKQGDWILAIALDKTWSTGQTRDLVNTKLLGKAKSSNAAYDNADGSWMRLDTDYFGRRRSDTNPFPGPFELPAGGKFSLNVWARQN